jgi:predicted transcriptional regulator
LDGLVRSETDEPQNYSQKEHSFAIRALGENGWVRDRASGHDWRGF